MQKKSSTYQKFTIMTEKERMVQVIETQGMNAKSFAEAVGIQSSTVSNILTGRNNPSLDVMQRILRRFPTLNSDWLILGKGEMYSTPSQSQMPPTPAQPSYPNRLFEEPRAMQPQMPELPLQPENSPVEPKESFYTPQMKEQVRIEPAVEEKEVQQIAPLTPSADKKTTQRTIEQVIIFYTDKSYEILH